MRLAAGDRVGPFEITGTLGVGGMGEVYRARDAKLNRDVALKVLPANVAGDPDRLASGAKRNSSPPSIIRTSRTSTGSRMLVRRRRW